MDIQQICRERFQLQKEFQGLAMPAERPEPLVSVCVATYQHVNFISQCLDGILMQKTSFPFEVIIGEDESTDGTRDICIEYAMKYPEIIRLFLRDRKLSQLPDENGVYICRFNGIWNRMAAKGKYIALCEGDDYWTDSVKLEKQIGFLEKNSDFAICHHNMKVMYEDNSKTPHLSNQPDQKKVTSIQDLAHGNYIYTASCIFRNGLIKEFPEWIFRAPVGDYPLHMLNAQFGKIIYFPNVMGVYRVHTGSVWVKQETSYRIEKWVELIDLMKNHFSREINDILVDVQTCQCVFLIRHFKGLPEKCNFYLMKIANNNPEFLINLIQEEADKTDQSNKLMQNIYNSYSYKIGNFIITPISFLFKLFGIKR